MSPLKLSSSTGPSTHSLVLSHLDFGLHLSGKKLISDHICVELVSILPVSIAASLF